MAITSEKLARDVIRLEIAALLSLARDGHSEFAQDVLAKATPRQRAWIKDEMRKIAETLRIKADAQDEA